MTACEQAGNWPNAAVAIVSLICLTAIVVAAIWKAS